jgi:site-specific DNA-methyltransferase (adenine-specific)
MRSFGTGVAKNNVTGKNIVSGRFPANIITDGSEEVLECFPNSKSTKFPNKKRDHHNSQTFCKNGGTINNEYVGGGYDDDGSAARFFYCAKASKQDRDEGLENMESKSSGVGALRDSGRQSEPRHNGHPTVKPTKLMAYLCRLITPPEGLVLDPFAGSGSTGKACKAEGFRFIGIEKSEEYCKIARARIT